MITPENAHRVNSITIMGDKPFTRHGVSVEVVEDRVIKVTSYSRTSGRVSEYLVRPEQVLSVSLSPDGDLDTRNSLVAADLIRKLRDENAQLRIKVRELKAGTVNE